MVRRSIMKNVMPTAHRKASMIALRARHQAYRIASDMLHPPLDVPRPPEPVVPLHLDPTYEPEPPFLRKPASPLSICLAVILWVLAITLIVYNCIHGWKSPL